MADAVRRLSLTSSCLILVAGSLLTSGQGLTRDETLEEKPTDVFVLNSSGTMRRLEAGGELSPKSVPLGPIGRDQWSAVLVWDLSPVLHLLDELEPAVSLQIKLSGPEKGQAIIRIQATTNLSELEEESWDWLEETRGPVIATRQIETQPDAPHEFDFMLTARLQHDLRLDLLSPEKPLLLIRLEVEAETPDGGIEDLCYLRHASIRLGDLFQGRTGFTQLERPETAPPRLNPRPGEFTQPLPPEMPGWLDVTAEPYLADPTGQNDSWGALLLALTTAPQGVFLPNGTYRISRPLVMPPRFGESVTFRGQSLEGTIIRLDGDSPDFQDSSKPAALLDFPPPRKSQEDERRPRVHVSDFTLELTEGNPGAVGMRFSSAPGGTLRRVRIAAPTALGVAEAPRIGLQLDDEPFGSLLVGEVSIEGFLAGIVTAGEPSSLLLHNVRLREQGQAGLWARGQAVTALNLRTEGVSQPVLQQSSDNAGGLLVLGRADLDAWSQRENAAVALKTGAAFIWDSTIRRHDLAVPKDLSDDTDRAFTRVTDGPGRKEIQGLATPLTAEPSEGQSQWLESLNGDDSAGELAVLEIEEVPWPKPERWLMLKAEPGASADDTRSFQALLDEARDGETVFLPAGEFSISSPLTIPGGAGRILGAGTVLIPTLEMQEKAGAIFYAANPKNTEPGEKDGGEEDEEAASEPEAPAQAGPLTIEGFEIPMHALSRLAVLRHENGRDVVLREVRTTGGALFQQMPGAGALFTESCAYESAGETLGAPGIKHLLCGARSEHHGLILKSDDAIRLHINGPLEGRHNFYGGIVSGLPSDNAAASGRFLGTVMDQAPRNQPVAIFHPGTPGASLVIPEMPRDAEQGKPHLAQPAFDQVPDADSALIWIWQEGNPPPLIARFFPALPEKDLIDDATHHAPSVRQPRPDLLLVRFDNEIALNEGLCAHYEFRSASFPGFDESGRGQHAIAGPKMSLIRSDAELIGATFDADHSEPGPGALEPDGLVVFEAGSINLRHMESASDGWSIAFRLNLPSYEELTRLTESGGIPQPVQPRLLVDFGSPEMGFAAAVEFERESIEERGRGDLKLFPRVVGLIRLGAAVQRLEAQLAPIAPPDPAPADPTLEQLAPDPLDDWPLIVFSLGRLAQLYVNGALVDQSAVHHDFRPATEGLSFGCALGEIVEGFEREDGVELQPLDGALAQVRVYSRMLNPLEAERLSLE